MGPSPLPWTSNCDMTTPVNSFLISGRALGMSSTAV